MGQRPSSDYSLFPAPRPVVHRDCEDSPAHWYEGCHKGQRSDPSSGVRATWIVTRNFTMRRHDVGVPAVQPMLEHVNWDWVFPAGQDGDETVVSWSKVAKFAKSQGVTIGCSWSIDGPGKEIRSFVATRLNIITVFPVAVEDVRGQKPEIVQFFLPKASHPIPWCQVAGWDAQGSTSRRSSSFYIIAATEHRWWV